MKTLSLITYSDLNRPWPAIDKNEGYVAKPFFYPFQQHIIARFQAHMQPVQSCFIFMELSDDDVKATEAWRVGIGSLSI
jgi:hypothetical protein